MKVRILSALIAISIVILFTYFFRTAGLYFVGILFILGALREYIQLALPEDIWPFRNRLIFAVFSIFIFLATLSSPEAGLVTLVLCSMLLLTLLLWQASPHRGNKQLSIILQQQSISLLGFLYTAIMPGFAIRLLQFQNGMIWLFGLLGIVFAGDTLAYLIGRRWGRHRLLEAVSPQKSIEGALAGLLGSVIASGCLGSFYFQNIPLWQLLLLGLITGIFGQAGDLFESLLKRVADVKDSGHIMPGHGGILDRLDGVFFAAPLYCFVVEVLFQR